jgi:hypothetical protein
MEEQIGAQMFDEGEVKLYRTIWRCCTAFLCILVLTIGGCGVNSTYQFAKNGYKETTLQGSSNHAWTK